MPRPAWLIRPPGLLPYAPVNDAMHDLAVRRIAAAIPDTVILLEHSPVFTAGRRAKPEELLWSSDRLRQRGCAVHRVDRGGSFTFHGPGQLVGYPILDLGVKPDVASHLRRMEEVVIRTASDLGIVVHRRDDVQTGVWAGDRKVCAIGVRLMRARVTLHGFAVNCNTDLSWFDGIIACGLPDHGVTSFSKLAGRDVTPNEVCPLMEHHLQDVFDLALTRPRDVHPVFTIGESVVAEGVSLR